MKKHLLDEPSPAPFSLPVPGCAAVTFLRGVVERVGIAQRGGGAPHARRLRIVEVLLRVSVLVVHLVLRPAGVARGQEWSVGSFPASARTQRPIGALTMLLLPKGAPRRTVSSRTGVGGGNDTQEKFPSLLSGARGRPAGATASTGTGKPRRLCRPRTPGRRGGPLLPPAWLLSLPHKQRRAETGTAGQPRTGWGEAWSQRGWMAGESGGQRGQPPPPSLRAQGSPSRRRCRSRRTSGFYFGRERIWQEHE